MRLKKFMAAAAAMLMIIGQTLTVMAADGTVISLDSSAKQFTKVEEDLDFTDMEPGETRTAKITFENTAADQMEFFINGEIIYNIADTAANNKNAIYDLTMTVGGESTPFFTGIIGSAENKKLASDNLGLNYLSDDTKIATLAKGETTSIEIKVTLDGDSAENVYENKAGKIRLNVYTQQYNASEQVTQSSSETPTTASQNFVDRVADVFTGDQTSVVLYVCIAVVALVLIFVLVLFSRKKKRDQK